MSIDIWLIYVPVQSFSTIVTPIISTFNLAIAGPTLYPFISKNLGKCSYLGTQCYPSIIPVSLGKKTSLNTKDAAPNVSVSWVTKPKINNEQKHRILASDARSFWWETYDKRWDLDDGIWTMGFGPRNVVCLIFSRPKNNSSKIAVQIHPKKGKFL